MYIIDEYYKEILDKTAKAFLINNKEHIYIRVNSAVEKIHIYIQIPSICLQQKITKEDLFIITDNPYKITIYIKHEEKDLNLCSIHHIRNKAEISPNQKEKVKDMLLNIINSYTKKIKTHKNLNSIIEFSFNL